MHELERRTDTGEVLNNGKFVRVETARSQFHRLNDSKSRPMIKLAVYYNDQGKDIYLSHEEVDDLCLILQYYKKVGEDNDKATSI